MALIVRARGAVESDEAALLQQLRVRELRLGAAARERHQHRERGEEEHDEGGLEQAQQLHGSDAAAAELGPFEVDEGEDGAEHAARGANQDGRYKEEDVHVDRVGDVELDGRMAAAARVQRAKRRLY